MKPRDYKASPSNVIRGQRYNPTLLPGAGTIVREKVQLVRAEDPSKQINAWEVALAPVFRNSVGPTVRGTPARFGVAGDGDGMYLVEMTWGGGGVGFTTEFQYPAHGASFAVIGDNVMLSVISNDLFTVYTEDSKPCVEAWVAPKANPTNLHPLVELATGAVAPGNINPIPAWAHTITVTKSDPAATVVIEFSFDIVNTFVIVRNMTAAEQSCEIPIPSRAQQVRITTSAGNAFGFMELAFT